MKRRQAPQRYVALSTTATALLLVSAWCAPSLASTHTNAPCPESSTLTDGSLHDLLGKDAVTSDRTTVPAVADTKIEPGSEDQEVHSKLEDMTLQSWDTPAIVMRLPGVPVSEQPRFRRHMFRTDI